MGIVDGWYKTAKSHLAPDGPGKEIDLDEETHVHLYDDGIILRTTSQRGTEQIETRLEFDYEQIARILKEGYYDVGGETGD